MWKKILFPVMISFWKFLFFPLLWWWLNAEFWLDDAVLFRLIRFDFRRLAYFCVIMSHLMTQNFQSPGLISFVRYRSVLLVHFSCFILLFPILLICSRRSGLGKLDLANFWSFVKSIESFNKNLYFSKESYFLQFPAAFSKRKILWWYWVISGIKVSSPVFIWT